MSTTHPPKVTATSEGTHRHFASFGLNWQENRQSGTQSTNANVHPDARGDRHVGHEDLGNVGRCHGSQAGHSGARAQSDRAHGRGVHLAGVNINGVENARGEGANHEEEEGDDVFGGAELQEAKEDSRTEVAERHRRFAAQRIDDEEVDGDNCRGGIFLNYF